jgi:signal transduction histidine kinase/ligand-binding sensor domain-containing protein
MPVARGQHAAALGLAVAGVLLVPPPGALALDPALEASQYSHTKWSVRDGFPNGNIYAMAQTSDGYLWLGGEFGLFRFDGVRFVPWQPPPGAQRPGQPYSLLVSRDGTLWIGTFTGLAAWRDGTLARYPELDGRFVTSLFEDREGTVWAGTLGGSPGTPTGRLCAIRDGGAQCDTEGGFGSFVWGLSEDGSGTLWAGAETGLWRIKPGPPRRYAMPRMRISDLSKSDTGQLLIAVYGAGLEQLAGDHVGSYPMRGAASSNAPLQDRDVNANKLLRDRDGALWIGTVERGLIHVRHGRANVFRRADGLSGDIVLSLLEDREGNVWVATTGGLDRFRELPVATITARQGLSTDNTNSVLAATDGSVWVATHDGLTRWEKGGLDAPTRTYREASGLPDDVVQSLYQDHRGRVWAFTAGGLTRFEEDRFVAAAAIPSGEVYSMTGDEADNLWLSGNRGLAHLRDGRLVGHFPWSTLGRREQAKVVLSERGGVWLSFWTDGGVSFFRDGRLRASYSAADGLGKGHVPGLHKGSDGALWAATEEGGLSRIADGRIATLTSRNGLPCDTVHWTIEDDDRSLWLYAACGLARITRSEVDAWVADPEHRVATTLWDAADGVRLRSVAPSSWGPPVAKATDGKLWFLTGEGVQVVDPHQLRINGLPPPVWIEQVTADGRVYPQNLTGPAVRSLGLPPRIRDLQIEFTALSLVAPEKVRFKYRLEGQDRDWREVVNDRRVQYSNLPPGNYRFRVIACNNSGVWNEAGDTLEFSVAAAYYQTIWFRALAAATLAALLFAGFRARVRIVERHAGEITALNERLMKAQEQERARIAGELHDSVMQQITALSLVLGTAKRRIASDADARGMVADVQRRLIDVGTEVRELSHDLNPPILQQAGLPEALRGYCDTFGHAHGLAVSSDIDGSVAELSAGSALALYRIAQEALGNAAKHAAPTRIDVRLARAGGDVVLTIADDGRGCDPGRPGKGGLGLVNMRERARQLHGTFELDGRPGRGTTVRVTVPFRPREPGHAGGEQQTPG